MKFRGDGADTKSQNEKIESIERPAEKTGDERVALHCGQAAEMS